MKSKLIAYSVQLTEYVRRVFGFQLSTVNCQLSTARGFTLIELMVVTGILVVITSLILANNTRFGGAVLL